MSAPAIDFPLLLARVDLRALVEAELGPPDRRGRWLCPYHDDRHSPGLEIRSGGQRFKCWTCGAGGTALDWIMLRDNVDVIEAARRLGGLEERPAPARRPSPAPRTKPSAPSACDDPDWQEAADAIVQQAAEDLWGPVGADARRWLRARGIADSTARRFRLGFLAEDVRSGPLRVLADDQERPRSIWAPRGLCFPWLAPGSSYDDPRWVGANVRRLAADVFAPLADDRAKCMAFRGSVRGHLYPWPDILPTQGAVPAVIAEGEIDALLGWQFAGHLANFGTVGGSTQRPHRSALVALARCPWWLLALDHDAAGVKAARDWKAQAPHKARRALLPFGKDLGDFCQAGGDLAEWTAAELARLTAPSP